MGPRHRLPEGGRCSLANRTKSCSCSLSEGMTRPDALPRWESLGVFTRGERCRYIVFRAPFRSLISFLQRRWAKGRYIDLFGARERVWQRHRCLFDLAPRSSVRSADRRLALRSVAHAPSRGHLEFYRQCSSRVSSMLINFPTASPNSDRMTTPASS